MQIAGYVILNEHTLGIIRSDQPQWLTPLAFLEGGYDPAKGPAVVSPRDSAHHRYTGSAETV